jgi:hypothetical protein
MKEKLFLLAASALLATFAPNPALAYQYYSDPNTGSGNCSSCHGGFDGPASTKGTVFPSDSNHEMHRDSANMATACELCHSEPDRFPVEIGSSTGTANNVGVGCTGCHMAEGLRKHHRINNVTVCQGCHANDAPPPPESTKPPYYGSADTNVRDPGNEALGSKTNENWSVGDFLGLDNDGNGLYDLADYAIGPYRILSATREGNNIRVTWQTAGGRTNTVQTASNVSGGFSNLSGAIKIPGVGLVTTNYLHIGGATNSRRFYRLSAQVP